MKKKKKKTNPATLATLTFKSKYPKPSRGHALLKELFTQSLNSLGRNAYLRIRLTGLILHFLNFLLLVLNSN